MTGYAAVPGDIEIELVRAAFAAMADGDLDAVLALMHEEVVFVPLAAAVTGESYTGHDGLRAWQADRAAVWDFAIQIDDVEAAGERALVCGRMRARGLGGGVEVDMASWWVVAVRDGKVSRVETFADEGEARAATAGP